MVGPNYQVPETELASQYSETEETAGSEVDLKEWWMQFDDPVLNEMIEEAIGNNYDLKIAAERIAQVRAQYQLASDNLWPEINLNGTTIRQRISQNIFNNAFNRTSSNFTNVPTALRGPPVQDLFIIGFDASWELDLFGRLRRLKESAYDELEASWENFRNVYISLLAEVATNYANYRSFQQRIENIEEQIDVEQEELSLSSARYRAGLRAEIEPLQRMSQVDGLRALLPPLETEVKQSLYSIAVLLGRQPEQIPENWAQPQPIPQARGKIPLGLPSDLLRRRPDIRLAERKLASATALIGAAIAELFPTFSLTGSFGFESIHSNNWFTKGSQFWSLGPDVSWPVIDFGRIRDKIDYQNAVQREALYFYEQTILKALEEVEDALAAYTQEERRLEALASQTLDLKQSRDLTLSLYQAGLVSLSDLLAAEREILTAEQTLISSTQTLSVDLMAVYKSLGGEWECSTTP
jgi:NodT family efflux transporter outer membrane factor (OMF) lipoprotein